MKRLRLLVTAGPTREMLDPVRFLSNLSTGEMGYQFARESKRRGHFVTLVSGPTSLMPPAGVRFVPVVTAVDMKRAVKKYFGGCDALIMTAAVCDYAPAVFSPRKMKRSGWKTVVFRRTDDILKSVCRQKGRRYIVGFCLETEDLEQNAVRKLREKKLDLIVANAFGGSKNPFGRNRTSVILIDNILRKQRYNAISKKTLSRHLLTMIESVHQ